MPRETEASATAAKFEMRMRSPAGVLDIIFRKLLSYKDKEDEAEKITESFLLLTDFVAILEDNTINSQVGEKETEISVFGSALNDLLRKRLKYQQAEEKAYILAYITKVIDSILNKKKLGDLDDSDLDRIHYLRTLSEQIEDITKNPTQRIKRNYETVFEQNVPWESDSQSENAKKIVALSNLHDKEEEKLALLDTRGLNKRSLLCKLSACLKAQGYTELSYLNEPYRSALKLFYVIIKNILLSEKGANVRFETLASIADILGVTRLQPGLKGTIIDTELLLALTKKNELNFIEFADFSKLTPPPSTEKVSKELLELIIKHPETPNGFFSNARFDNLDISEININYNLLGNNTTFNNVRMTSSQYTELLSKNITPTGTTILTDLSDIDFSNGIIISERFLTDKTTSTDCSLNNETPLLFEYTINNIQKRIVTTADDFFRIEPSANTENRNLSFFKENQQESIKKLSSILFNQFISSDDKKGDRFKAFCDFIDKYTVKTENTTASRNGKLDQKTKQKELKLEKNKSQELIAFFLNELVENCKSKKDQESFEYLSKFSEKYNLAVDLSSLDLSKLNLENHVFKFKVILSAEQYKYLIEKNASFKKEVVCKGPVTISGKDFITADISQTTFLNGIVVDQSADFRNTKIHEKNSSIQMYGRNATTSYKRHSIVSKDKPITYTYKTGSFTDKIETTPAEILPYLQGIIGKRTPSHEKLSSSQIFLYCFSHFKKETLTAFAELIATRFENETNKNEKKNYFLQLIDFIKEHKLSFDLSNTFLQSTDLIEKIKEINPFQNCRLNETQVRWLLAKRYGSLLKGANLSGLNLSNFDFSNCDLTGTNFSNCNLIGANFTNATLNNTEFSRANISKADFTKSTLNEKTSFEESTSNHESNFKGTTIQALQFLQLTNGGKEQFNDCTILLTSNYRGTIYHKKFENVNFLLSNDTDININNSEFEKCSFESDENLNPAIRFSSSTLNEAEFHGNCSKISIDHTNTLNNCNFRGVPKLDVYDDKSNFGKSKITTKQFKDLIGFDNFNLDATINFGNADIYLQNADLSGVELDRKEKGTLSEMPITLHLNSSKFNNSHLITEHAIADAKAKFFTENPGITIFKIAFDGLYTGKYNNFDNIDISNLTIQDPTILLTASLKNTRLNREQVVYLLEHSQHHKIRQADLSGCDISGLDLSSVDFTDTKIDDLTKFNNATLRLSQLTTLEKNGIISIENATILFDKKLDLSNEKFPNITHCKIKLEQHELPKKLLLPHSPFEIDATQLVKSFNKYSNQTKTDTLLSTVEILNLAIEGSEKTSPEKPSTDQKVALLAVCEQTKLYKNIDASNTNFFNQDLSEASLENANLDKITISYSEGGPSTNFRKARLEGIGCDQFTCVYNGNNVNINTESFTKLFIHQYSLSTKNELSPRSSFATNLSQNRDSFGAKAFKIFQHAQENPRGRTAKILDSLLETLSYEQSAKLVTINSTPLTNDEINTFSDQANENGLNDSSLCRSIETMATDTVKTTRFVYKHFEKSAPFTLHASDKVAVLNIEKTLVFDPKKTSLSYIEPSELKRVIDQFSKIQAGNDKKIDCIQIPIALEGRKHFAHLQIYKKDDYTIGARIIDSSGRGGLPTDGLPEKAVKEMLEKNLATYNSLLSIDATKVHTSVVSTNVQYSDNKCGLYVFGGIKATTHLVLAKGPDFLKSDIEVKRTIQAEHKMADNTQPIHYLAARVTIKNNAPATEHTENTVEKPTPVSKKTAKKDDEEDDFVVIDSPQRAERKTVHFQEDTAVENPLTKIDTMDTNTLISALNNTFTSYKENHRKIGVSFFRQFFDAGKNYMEDAQIRLAKAPDDKKADVAKHIAKEIIAQGYDRTTNSFIRKPNSRVDCLLKEMQEQKLLPADNTTLRNR